MCGVSYVVLAPEHPLVEKLTSKKQKKVVDEYIFETSKCTEIDRLSTTREKTGVYIGHNAINPINNTLVPIYVADYVLYSYGTGAVMGVPSHDERDFAFAKKYNLPLKVVIQNQQNPSDCRDEAYTEEGILVNSNEFNGMKNTQAKKAITQKAVNEGFGEFKTQYRLRDWLISRQRYWGAPIPMINKPNGEVVGAKEFPVVLPEDVIMDGVQSPIKSDKTWAKVTVDGVECERETDTFASPPPKVASKDFA